MRSDRSVLVTGATGFLGGAVVRHLAAQGWAVVALGRNPEKLAALAPLGVKTVALDLSKPEPAAHLRVGPIDTVVHCAGLSAPWGPKRAFEAANVTGTETVLHMAHRLGVRRFVNISSPTVYFALSDQEQLPETTPLPPPINAYAATKAEAERRVLNSPDLGPISLRPRGLYGAGDSALLPRLLSAAKRGPLPLLRGGRAAIDLTHVSDVVRAIDAALNAADDVQGNVFNISGGEQIAVRDIVEAAAARAGTPVRWRALPFAPLLAAARARALIGRAAPWAGEPRITPYTLGLFAFRQSLDLSKAERLLGWTPSLSFAQGLDLTFQGPRP